MEQSLVLHLCTWYCFTSVANKEISQGKLFILSGKVRENEFCKVVGTLWRKHPKIYDSYDLL